MYNRKVIRMLSVAVALLMMLLCCVTIASAEEPVPIEGAIVEQEIVPQVEQEEEEEEKEEVVERPDYTLTFLAYNEEILYEEDLKEGAPMVLPFFIPMRDGFIFLHWYSVSEFEKTNEYAPFVFGSGIQEDTVLMPFYEALPEPPEENDEQPVTLPGKDDGQPSSLPGDGVEQPSTLPGEEDVPENAGMLGDQIVTIIDDPVDEETENENDETVNENEEETVNGAGALVLDEGTQDVKRSIEIFSSHTECIDVGTTIRVWAILTGFAAEDANLMWQYLDAEGWHDAEGGADTLEYTFEATSETVNYGWRLAASLKD